VARLDITYPAIQLNLLIGVIGQVNWVGDQPDVPGLTDEIGRPWISSRASEIETEYERE
jgi:hypothetical protein